MEQSSPYKQALMVQLREAYGRIVYSYTTHLKMMERLIRKNRKIKYVQIGLSAISAGGFIGAVITNEATLTCIGGIFSTILLGINLFFKDFNLHAEIDQHRTASNDLWLIRERYISLLTDFDILEEDEIKAKRESLQIETFETYKVSPKTDSKSYLATQRSLKTEEEQFFTSGELDRILPEHLRKSY